ncbi:NAD(P)-dependent oxidoreductase [Parabacteroides sp. OttesenSCG-928-K15]|nr:NAD(P)-dependent oxidoreductase [Parabacteroides sp. OttesenSCG-928-K15]
MGQSINNDERSTRKVLITGASGFIGSFLVKEALRRGYEVWAGIRRSSNRERLQDARIQFIDLKYEDEEALVGQLSEFAATNGAWDFIVHNAGLTKTIDPQAFYRVNAENTRVFITSLAKAGCVPRKFLLMSSLSSYGVGDEKGFTPLRLSDTQRPNTAYGESKRLAEEYVRGQSVVPYVIMRPTGVYGPGDKDYFMEIKSIQSGFDFAVGMTPQRITFIYVKDLARAVFLALENEAVVNRHYFVADGDVYTDKEFAAIIRELLAKKHVLHARIPTGLVWLACLVSEWIGKLAGKSITLNRDKYKILKQRNWICEVEPLQDELGFKPDYRLRAGLTEAIAWYRRAGWL